MDKKLIMAALTVPLLTACVVDPHYRYSEVVIEPGLPQIVQMGPSPYYRYGEHVYYYDNARWFYSRSHVGPWTALPPHRYPHEVHHHHRGDIGHRQGRGHYRHHRN